MISMPSYQIVINNKEISHMAANITVFDNTEYRLGLHSTPVAPASAVFKKV